MQLVAHIAYARYIIEQTFAVCNFFTNWLFSKNILRAAWMEDLYNLLKKILPAAILFKSKK